MDETIMTAGQTYTIRVSDDGVADLTRPVKPPIRVRIAPDLFEFAGEAPGDLARILGRLEDDATQIAGMLEFLDLVILPTSKDRFTARMSAAENPITFDHLQDLFVYLADRYMGADRPTQPGSSSADGSTPGGPILTGTPPSAASTPPQSVSPDY